MGAWFFFFFFFFPRWWEQMLAFSLSAASWISTPRAGQKHHWRALRTFWSFTVLLFLCQIEANRPRVHGVQFLNWRDRSVTFCAKGTLRYCYALNAVQFCTWCGLLEVLPRYGAHYSCNKADIPHLFLSSQWKMLYFIWNRVDNCFYLSRQSSSHFFQLARASVAVMPAMMDSSRGCRTL